MIRNKESQYSNTVSILNNPYFQKLERPSRRLKTDVTQTKFSTFSHRTHLKIPKNKQIWRTSQNVGNINLEKYLNPKITNGRKWVIKNKKFSDKEKQKISARSKQNRVQFYQDKIKLYSPDKAMIKFKKKMNEIKELNKTSGHNDLLKQLYKERFQVYSQSIKGSKHSENQDSLKFSQNVFVICDGHGSNGKQVSSFVAQVLHEKLFKLLEQGKVKKINIEKAYKNTELDLQVSGLDISFSGCACLSIIFNRDQIFCANTGDCKAFLRRGYKDQVLSNDHRPDKPEQKSRVQQCGGVIRQIEISKDKFCGPPRIWAPGKNSWGPGLALSRAFGDKAAKKFGLISQPFIYKTDISKNTEFIVLGSDGLFDQMSIEEIGSQIHKNRDENENREQICEKLAMQAKSKWQDESDDISLIIIFL